MISDRLKWKPKNPLMVLLLRVHHLTQPQIIPYNDVYGGCKSWIDLVQSISTDSTDQLIPVIDDSRYSHKVQEIKKILFE